MPNPESYAFDPGQGYKKYCIDYFVKDNRPRNPLTIDVWCETECVAHELAIHWNQTSRNSRDHHVRKQQ